MPPPVGERFRADAEGDVPRPAGPCGGNIPPRSVAAGLKTSSMLAGPDPQEDLPARLPADDRHPENAGVEPLGGGQVGGVHDGLDYGLDGGRGLG